jgi:hypothetical protein
MDEDKSINAFCSIDGEGKRMAPMTLGEKEQLFLEALSVSTASAPVLPSADM